MPACTTDGIVIKNGAKTLAKMPLVVSASRSTDIPAFYADWFMSRLKAGYSVWVNPFNHERYRVSFADMRMIVFWSKNPKPMLDKLNEVEALGFRQYYFQLTLNDYMAEGLEPNVPPAAERIDTFKRLADRIGKERVIWRFDPLMLTEKISIDALLERGGNIGQQLKGYTEKLVFSFIDIAAYRKVQKNLAGLGVREFSPDDQIQFAQGLAELNQDLRLELATCGELADLGAYGIMHNKCVDDELMMRLFHDDAELMDFIGAEYDMFNGWQIKKSKKDKGQRKACGCIVSKDIGMYNTCRHFCVYCYANTSKECVLKNVGRHNDESESLIG